MSTDIYEGFSATFVIDGKTVDIKHGDEIPKGLPKDVREELIRQSDEVRAAQDSDALPLPSTPPEPSQEEPKPSVGGIDGYDDLKVADILPLITAENAAAVKEYEEAKDSPRSTVVDACDKALAAS